MAHSALDYLRIGSTFSNGGQQQEAIDLYRHALTFYPAHPGLHRELGAVLDKSGNPDEGLVYYREAIALQAEQPFWVYNRLGHLLIEQAQWAEAIDIYQAAVTLYPDKIHFGIYRELGDALRQVGQWQLAIDYYRQALALKPELVWLQQRIDAVQFNWGIEQLEQKQFEEALSHFQEVDQVHLQEDLAMRWPQSGNERWPYSSCDWIENGFDRSAIQSQLPKITVVTPSLNQGLFLEETILSILNQKYPNLEYIVVDGGSTDSTPEILNRYRDRITKVIVEPDRGQSDAINKGFRLATGELLLWLNSDDLLFPGALYQLALSYLEEPCEVIAGICAIHQDGQITALRKPRVRQADFTVEALSDVARLWANGHFFVQPEVCFSRDIWQRIGGNLNESLHYAMDHDLWMRFAEKKATLKIIDYPVALFRRHREQKTANSAFSIQVMLQVIQQYCQVSLDNRRAKEIEYKVSNFSYKSKRNVAVVAGQSTYKLDTFYEESGYEESGYEESGKPFGQEYRITFCQTLEDLELDTLYDAVIIIANLPKDTLLISQLRPSSKTLLIAWCWSNHHCLAQHMQIAEQVDIFIPAQHYIKDVFKNSESIVTEAIPTCLPTWNDGSSSSFEETASTRSNQLFGLFAKNLWPQRRNHLIEAVQDTFADSAIVVTPQLNLPDTNLLAEYWQRGLQFKVALCLPEQFELPLQVFAALFYGQIPIVSEESLDLDRIIPPEVQQDLPIIRLSEYSVEAVQKAHHEAIQQFDREGLAGIRRRHQYIVEKHLLTHRLKAIFRLLHESWMQSGKRLAESAQPASVKPTFAEGASTTQANSNYLEIAKALSEDGKGQEAIAVCQKGLALYPESSELSEYLTRLQQQYKGNTMMAQHDEVRSEHKSLYSYLQQVQQLGKQEQFREAIELCQKAIEQYPDQAKLHREMGGLYKKISGTEGAIANYQKAIDLEPEQPFWVYTALGNILTVEKKAQQAVAVLQNGIKLYPEQPELYLALGFAQDKTHDVLGRIASLRKAIALEPKQTAAVYLGLGKSLAHQGHWDEAIAVYKQGVELYPQNAELSEELAALVNMHTVHPVPSHSEVHAVPKDVEICPTLDDRAFIEFCFIKLVHRKPSEETIVSLVNSLQKRSRSDFLINFLNGEEVKSKYNFGTALLPDLNNEEFIDFVTAILFREKVSKQFKANLLKALQNGNLRTTVVANQLAADKLKQYAEEVLNSERASHYYMVGNRTPLSVQDWYVKFAQNTRNYYAEYGRGQLIVPQTSLQPLLGKLHSPIVSIITSVYDGDEFIEPFMRHICEQSIFKNDCELIIIDANSPGNEYDCIKRYCEKYDNILYHRYNERITIYDAWNIGAQKARGLFLTNANLDDIKRFDCLEKQARELILNPDVDIVYSDYAYTLEPNLPFELVCLEGHQSNLPVANIENLLQFNSPHCGPMWRKSLHDSVGYFDASYRSAGDMELWMKAALAGHQFGKIDQTLIAYYLNPKGLSTDHSGVGRDEGASVIEKYQALYQEKQAKNSEAVSYKIPVTLNQGQQLEISIPDNRLPVPQSAIGRSSYFAFSIYKSGSTLLTDILELALDQKEDPRPKVDLSKQMFKAGVDGRDWMVDENLNSVVLPGYWHVGFREFAPFLEQNPVFRNGKKVLLVRDPRDALVSFYYSVLKSHRITEGEFGKSQQEFREQVQTLNIDNFVKEQCGWIKRIFEAYMQSPSMSEKLRIYKYEEIIFDKASWLKDLFSYLDIEISTGRKRFILNHVNVVPTSEDAQKHIRNVVPGDHTRKLQTETIEFLNRELKDILDHFNYIL